jgi:hypothetical protein
VISIVGTLVLVLGLWLFRRWRRSKSLSTSSPDKKSKSRVDPYDPTIRDSGDTQMDLLGRDGLRIDTGNNRSGPSSPIDPFSTPLEARGFQYGPIPIGGPSRSSTLDNLSPTAPAGTGTGTGTGTMMTGITSLGRASSQEALLSHASPTIRSQQSQSRRLHLHDTFGEQDQEEEESSDLKRETLAALESQPQPGSSQGRRPPRPRREDVETEYVVHRDGGRARVELPPRYHEVEWEER